MSAPVPGSRSSTCYPAQPKSDETLAAAVSLITGPRLTGLRMSTLRGLADDELAGPCLADAIDEAAARQVCDHQVGEVLAIAVFDLTVDQRREGLWGWRSSATTHWARTTPGSAPRS